MFVNNANNTFDVLLRKNINGLNFFNINNDLIRVMTNYIDIVKFMVQCGTAGPNHCTLLTSRIDIMSCIYMFNIIFLSY